jgi:hypothetical protein
MGVAGVAVVAVVGGGVLAARSVPSVGEAVAAAPIPAAAPLTPSIKPTPAPGAVVSTKVELAKLKPGRTPQLAYLTGRVIKGGLGSDLTVPGKQEIIRAVRYGGDALVVLEVGMGDSELATVTGYQGFLPERIADVSSLVSSVNEDMVAFGTARTNADHTRRKGNLVYWRGEGADRKLQRPDDWASRVLAVAGDTVYFAADTDRDGLTSALYSWNSLTSKVDRLSTFKSPAGVDFQGANGVDQIEGAAQTFCAALRELDNGKQLWRTCEYSLDGFTPDGRTVFGTPDFHNGGSDAFTVAIDAATGSVKRRWVGPQFLNTRAEDDDHLLIAVDSGEKTSAAIIRCSIGTGVCELATTPVPTKQRGDLRLLGGWQ